jgi:thioredoxin-like negative regulator of GroEL
MDARLAALKRAWMKSPDDVTAAIRLATAFEQLGDFDQAWEVLECFPLEPDARTVLGDLAEENPRGVHDRLQRLDYRNARLMTELLVACGQARNPALVALASDPAADRKLRAFAAKALSISPDASASADTRGFVRRVMEKSGKSQAVALLPWLMPLLTSGNPTHFVNALAAVRRLTPDAPFDVNTLARLMTRQGDSP